MHKQPAHNHPNALLLVGLQQNYQFSLAFLSVTQYNFNSIFTLKTKLHEVSLKLS